jgi:hypothetical protein
LGKHTFFLSFREGVYKKFEGLFNNDSSGDEGDDDEFNGRLTIQEINARKAEERKSSWSWIGLIYKLCEGDITKTEAVVNKPFIECLVWLSYEKENID